MYITTLPGHRCSQDQTQSFPFTESASTKVDSIPLPQISPVVCLRRLTLSSNACVSCFRIATSCYTWYSCVISDARSKLVRLIVSKSLSLSRPSTNSFSLLFPRSPTHTVVKNDRVSTRTRQNLLPSRDHPSLLWIAFRPPSSTQSSTTAHPYCPCSH